MLLKKYINENHKTQRAFAKWWPTTEARVSTWVSAGWCMEIVIGFDGEERVRDYILTGPKRSKRVFGDEDTKRN